jgi:hypothetical protein
MFYNDGKVIDLEKGYIEKNKLAGMYYGWSFMGKESINMELPMNKIASPNRISGIIMLTQAYLGSGRVGNPYNRFAEDRYEIKAYYLKVNNVINKGSNNWDLVFEIPENIPNINLSKDSSKWPSGKEKSKENIISGFTVK